MGGESLLGTLDASFHCGFDSTPRKALLGWLNHQGQGKKEKLNTQRWHHSSVLSANVAEY